MVVIFKQPQSLPQFGALMGPSWHWRTPLPEQRQFEKHAELVHCNLYLVGTSLETAEVVSEGTLRVAAGGVVGVGMPGSPEVVVFEHLHSAGQSVPSTGPGRHWRMPSSEQLQIDEHV